MAAVLIGEADFEPIKALIGSHTWENCDLCYPAGYWLPESLFSLAAPVHSFAVAPVAKAPNIPIFYGNASVNRFAYNESLTCVCKSREDGSKIKGISLLPPGWYEPQYFEFKRCFRYQEPGDTERFWRIIACNTDIDWLLGCWDLNPELSMWLAGNSLGQQDRMRVSQYRA